MKPPNKYLSKGMEFSVEVIRLLSSNYITFTISLCLSQYQNQNEEKITNV